MSQLKFYAQIRKVDEEQRMVWGYASTEAVDSQGEVVKVDAIKAAWDDYMKFANVREMHQPLAAGVVKEFQFDDKGVEIGVHVVDDQAWEKVKKEVYKGFSIGGRKKPGGFDKATKTISALELTEISLVDRPANPEALISMWKMDGATEEPETAEGNQAQDPSQGLTPEQFEQFLKSAGALDVLKRVLAANPDLVVAKTEKPPTDPVTDPSAEQPREPSELRKAFRAVKLGGDDLQKGLYTVASLADTLQSLSWIQQSCQYEAEYEGDKSPVPAQLLEALKALGASLVAMAQEEVAELIADLSPEDTAPAVDVITMMHKVLAKSQAADFVGKVNDASFTKAGARNNAADQDRIQKMHDLSNELGAACPGTAKHTAVEDVAKHENHNHGHGEDLAKVSGDLTKLGTTLEKLSSNLGSTNKRVDDLGKAIDSIVEILKKTSAQPKGVLRVVGKGSDGTGEIEGDQPPVVEPVRKADGTIDEVMTSIKQIHKSGGMPIAR